MTARLRAAAVFRALDSGDLDGLAALLADDAQLLDEDTVDWVRGRAAIRSYLEATTAPCGLITSRLEDAETRCYPGLELETFTLRQVVVLDGIATELLAPTTATWVDTADGWRLTLLHSVPLATPLETPPS